MSVTKLSESQVQIQTGLCIPPRPASPRHVAHGVKRIPWIPDVFNQVIVRLWINFRAVRGRHRTPRIIFMHLEQPPPASPSRSRQGPRCRGGQRRAEGTCRRETRPRFLRHAVTERLVYLSHGAGAGDRALGAVDAEPMAQQDRQTDGESTARRCFGSRGPGALGAAQSGPRTSWESREGGGLSCSPNSATPSRDCRGPRKGSDPTHRSRGGAGANSGSAVLSPLPHLENKIDNRVKENLGFFPFLIRVFSLLKIEFIFFKRNVYISQQIWTGQSSKYAGHL